jgi:hypothetical protein
MINANAFRDVSYVDILYIVEEINYVSINLGDAKINDSISTKQFSNWTFIIK